MYLLIIFLPFIGSILSGVFGKFFGSFNSIKVTFCCIFLCLVLTLLCLIEILHFRSIVYINLFYWIDSEFLNIKWGFLFDNLTIIMCFLVSFISLNVHLYSAEYMLNDPYLNKFMSYLSMFTFFMLILITSDNCIQLFIGWEGVGLCSYLLINFWFIRIQANKAAIKAMIINRIGDFGLLFGLFLVFIHFKTFEYSNLNLLISYLMFNEFLENQTFIDFISFFLFLGAIGKSAQLGLHTWLPDAMEGPTPVSALIHAATMVTAGVFLNIRMALIFECSNFFSNFIIIFGILTAFISSLIGLNQNDSKKIVAYSTCSQLGYMVFSCGLHDYFIGFFHLINHGFFKALLFLCSGSIIHAINEEQDIRKMGGLKKMVPLTYISNIIGSFALIGLPFLTGFYSKDFILESAISKFNNYSFFCYFVGSFGAFLTAFYSFRSIFLIFLSKPNGFKNIINYTTDSNFVIKFVLILLSFFSIFFCYFTKDLFIGFGSNFLNSNLIFNLNFYNTFNVEFIIPFLKLLPNLLSFLGVFLVFILYINFILFLYKIKSIIIFIKIYNFFNKKFFFDKIYNEIFSQFFFKFSYSVSYKLLDRGLFELIGPLGLSLNSLKFSKLIKKLKTNFMYNFLIIIIINLLIILSIINFFEFLYFPIMILNLIILFFIIIIFNLTGKSNNFLNY